MTSNLFQITLEHYIIVSIILFICGLTAAVARRNIFISFLGILMMLFSANVAVLAFARWMLLPAGNIVSFFISTIFCIIAISGLLFFVSYLKNGNSIYGKESKQENLVPKDQGKLRDSI